MSRRLLFFSPSDERLEGACRIDGTYPRGYTEEDMRRWAKDLDRVLALSPEERARLRATKLESLTPDEQALRCAQAHHLDDPSRGIKGSLRPDGKIELDGGRHRAAYAQERGVAALPVWVSGGVRELDALERKCLSPQRVTGAARDDVTAEPTANGGGLVNERAFNPETSPEKWGELPPKKRPVDPELVRKLGQTAIREQVEHPERTAKVERVQPDAGRVALRGAQRSEDRRPRGDRPPNQESRERS